MDSIFVLGFTAAVIGGLDSPVGAIVGGLILGVALNYVGGYLGSNLVPMFGLIALMAVLMIRPSGLFSATHEPAGVTMTLLRHLVAAARRGSGHLGTVRSAQCFSRLSDGGDRRLRGGDRRAVSS